MDLIDRYLDAVRLFLPAGQRDDIAAELRDVLMNRREEKEAELGRPLTRAEDESLLHDYGHPLMVAARYGRQRYLIGPELYPVYVFVAAIVLASIGVAAAVSAVVATTTAGGDAWRGFGAAMGVAWSGAFTGIGAVTIIFALLERTGASRRITIDWSVRDLPRITRRRPVKGWFEHVTGMVFLILFAFWWVGLLPLWTPDIPLESGGVLHLAFAPELKGLYLPVLAFAAIGIAVHGMKLGGAEVRVIAQVFDAVLQVSLAGLAAIALHAGHWAVASGDGVAQSVLAQVEKGVNIGAEVTLIVLICTALGRLAVTLWQLLRRSYGAGVATNGA
ncbi:MAG TPA: hypothetical protein VFE13_18680 [Caulobacteraceae bacterium]|jgi:hypothetical protein|nr:hypothetical protein [Caulobacteraceae bacterium]